MKLSEVKTALTQLEDVNFKLPNGLMVDSHFHVTEIGIITKKFIDCGGTIREEKVVNFQLWNANDLDHKLKPSKLLQIIQLAERVLEIKDLEIEVEYQNDTIGKYDLSYNGVHFLLLNKQTNCLAQDNCGVPVQKHKTSLQNLTHIKNTCTPGGSCC